jgi:hypothetical protein
VNQRHTEFFGPDLARGPYPPNRIETATLQIATALAQLRAPLTRDDDALRGHVDFIRELADRLAPDWAAQITIDVGEEVSNAIATSIIAVTGTYSLLECWLADAPGGGISAYSPASVTWNTGTVLQTITANKHYLIVTPYTGVADVTVSYPASRTWYWAVCRHGRVHYSSQVFFW